MSAKGEAIERLAKAAVKVVDDWGWKGGKPGEITGGKYMKDLNIKADDLIPRLSKDFGDMGPNDADYLMQWFADMEAADIPRQWTGKIAKALWNSNTSLPFDESPSGMATNFQNISNLMRPMTNDQRQTFLSLLPRWTGSLDQAAAAAKKLYRR